MLTKLPYYRTRRDYAARPLRDELSLGAARF